MILRRRYNFHKINCGNIQIFLALFFNCFSILIFRENLLMAMLGEQFMVGDEICGAVVSIRYQEDIISVWNRTANDTMVTNRIRDTFRRVLNLPPGTIIEYIKFW